MSYELAQVNIARLAAPLDDQRLHDFVAALDPVNAVADAAPGFRWRLQTEDGNATGIQAFTWDRGDGAGIIVNMSVWASVEDLAAFVYSGDHREVLRRRREWFLPMLEAVTALWWVPAGERPTTDEAEQRVRHLRANGPSKYSFTLRTSFARPGTGVSEPLSAPDDWLCPA